MIDVRFDNVPREEGTVPKLSDRFQFLVLLQVQSIFVLSLGKKPLKTALPRITANSSLNIDNLTSSLRRTRHLHDFESFIYLVDKKYSYIYLLHRCLII
jgi:hypothetical protein